MRYRIAISSVVVALAVAGCGGSGSGTSSDKSVAGIRATLRAFLDDIKNGKAGDACDLMTKAARTQVGHGNADACGATVVLARKLLGAKALADVEAKIGQVKITITGDHATVPALTGGGSTTNMVYTDGHWLVGTNS